MWILQHAFIRVDAHVASYPATQIEMILIRRAGPGSYFEHMVGRSDIPQKELFEARVARNRIVAQPQSLDRIGEPSLEQVLCPLLSPLSAPKHSRAGHSFLLRQLFPVTRDPVHSWPAARLCQGCESWRCRGPSRAKDTFDRTSERKLPKSNKQPGTGKKPLRHRRTRNLFPVTFSRLAIGHA